MSKTDPTDVSHEPIKPDEEFIRIIYSPEHVDDMGRIKPSAVSSQDLDLSKVDRDGYSVERKLFVKKSYIEANIQRYLNRSSERKLHGFAVIKHNDIINIRDLNGHQALRVKPAPIPDNDAHALIICRNQYQPAIIRKFRDELINKFLMFQNLNDLFS